MATSKLQEAIKYRLRVLFQGYEFSENYYPAWLVNPETGKGMELDFWLPEAKIAIEVQGRQHYEYVPFFHGSVENFRRQVAKDQVKREACKAYGVLLWEVYEFDDIEKHLKQAGLHSTNILKQLRKKNVALNAMAFFAAELARESGKTKIGKGKHRDVKAMLRQRSEVKKADLTRKMIILSTKYDIPLKSVAPDYTVKKLEVAFPQSPIIVLKLKMTEGMEGGGQREITVRRSKAAIISIRNNGRVIVARWIDKPLGWKRGRKWIEREFDLWGNMSAVGRYGNTWRVDKESLPNLSDYPHLFEVSCD